MTLNCQEYALSSRVTKTRLSSTFSLDFVALRVPCLRHMVFCFAERGLVSMPEPQRLHPKALHAADQELASALHEQLDRMQDCLIAEQRKAIQASLHVAFGCRVHAQAVHSPTSWFTSSSVLELRDKRSSCCTACKPVALAAVKRHPHSLYDSCSSSSSYISPAAPLHRTRPRILFFDSSFND